MKKVIICLSSLLLICAIALGVYFVIDNKKENNPVVEIESSYSNITKTDAEKIATEFIENSEYKREFSEMSSSYMADKTWLVCFMDEPDALDSGVTVTVDDNTKQVIKVQVGYAKPIEIM